MDIMEPGASGMNGFEKIKEEYGKLHLDMIKKGSFPMKDTGIGYWSIAVSDDILELFNKINLGEYHSFLDLGSGDGKVALIASLFTNAFGIEYDKELHKTALKMKLKLKSKAAFYNGDYMQHDLSRYDIIFIHPDKELTAVEAKLLTEFKGKVMVYGSQYQLRSIRKTDSFTALTTPVTVHSMD